MDSQSTMFDGLKEDIREIKKSISELAKATTTLALHNQRLDNAEKRIADVEKSADDLWDVVRDVQTTCILREPVFKYGLKRMDTPSVSHEDWLTMLIGSATRNGIWIILTGILMALVNRYVR